jgi:hypothetical protein
MSNQATDIREAIRALSGMDELSYETSICKVLSVDESNFTCKCEPIDGSADFFGVLLNADKKKGFVLIPKVGSFVVISQMSETTSCVVMVSEVSQVYIAGDENGGLVKVQILNAALNNLQTEINTLKTTLSANLTAMGTALSAVDGGVTTAQAGILSALVLPQINISQIENTKVKHGNGG